MSTLARHAIRCLALAVGALVFVVNPGFGCTGGGDDYEYGEAEMRAAAAGKWRVSGSSGSIFTMDVAAPTKTAIRARAMFLREAAACGNREFFKPASACISSSTLYLTGQVTDGASPGAVSGSFMVWSRIFGAGSLELRLPGGRTLRATISDKASQFEGQLVAADGFSEMVTLTRQ